MPPVPPVPPVPSASPVRPEHAADIAGLLAMAVAGIGGAERPGQVAMAQAVQTAIETGEHLAVQAGTGTGKSLAYLVPAAVHAVSEEATVVVSTATIALQRQLIDRDLPRLAAAIAPALGREPVFAILKGRRNYLCLQRLRGGPADDQDEALFDPGAVSAIGRQVQRLHEWAATTKTGDRDELVPGVGEQAWRQVSVSARECLGVQRCPFGTRCFAELARDDAGRADIVVTNHALLAIDALEDFDIFPEHDVVIVDEAHDLVDRVTSVASDELSAAAVEVAARRCGRMIEEKAVARLRDAGLGMERMLTDVPEGRMDMLDEALASALESVRDAAAGCAAEFRTSAQNDEEADRLAARRAALAAVGDAADAAERILGAFGPAIADRPDVVWLDRPSAEESGRPPTLRVAPLRVGGLLASRLFGRRTAVLTSATLALGGSFEPLARQWGLPDLRGLGPPGAGGDVPAGSLSAARSSRWPDSGAYQACQACRARQVPAETGPQARLERRRIRQPARATARASRDGNTRWPGRELTSDPRSTTRAAESCTLPGTFRRRGATASPTPTWTRSPSSSRQRAAVPSGCSPRCGRRARRPASCAGG